MPNSLPRRLFSGLVATIVGAFTILDLAIGPVLRPLGAALARSSPMSAIRRLSRRMPAYVALLALLVPLAVAEPAKIFALYLIGDGHYVWGVVTLGASYLVSLMLVDTIYDGARPQLRSIAWFAAAVDRISAVRIAITDRIRLTKAYQAAQAVALRWRARVRAEWRRLMPAGRLREGIGRASGRKR